MEVRKCGPVVMLAVVLVMVLAAVAWAADGVPTELLQDVTVVFGAVTLAWLSVQKGVIHVLKGVHIGDKQLLATPQMIWLANGALAILGLTIAATQSGQPFAASAIQAFLAFLAAAGLHEFQAKTGKENAPTGTASGTG